MPKKDIATSKGRRGPPPLPMRPGMTMPGGSVMMPNSPKMMPGGRVTMPNSPRMLANYPPKKY